MSEENVEIVRRGLEDFAVTGELAPEVAEDLVWDMSTFRGWQDGLIRHIQVYSAKQDALDAAGLRA